MLEGIEVLNQIEITKVPDWILFALFISACALVVAMIIAIITEWKNALIATCISIVAFIVFLVAAFIVDIPTGRYKYQVTIDESVSLIEFRNKYEIINVEGKIYTIKERHKREVGEKE